jgi:hypothetical protein
MIIEGTMSTKTDQLIEALDLARNKTPVGSVWLHKKGGTYQVIGHVIDTDYGEARVRYRRLAGPAFNARKESLVEFVRPTSEWTPDRFIQRPNNWVKAEHWRCKACGRFKNEGCGGPDRLVPVPYESGTRLERPACPLEYVGPKPSVLTRLKELLIRSVRRKPG